MNLLVTDGETRSALATVRSLGRRGHTVYVVSTSPSLAGASRFAAGEHRIASARASPRAWAEELEKLIEHLGVDLLIPVTEISMGSIYGLGLEARWPVACPGRGAYESVVDKYALLERARSVGIEAPHTVLVQDPSELQELPPGFRYPVVLKGRRSHLMIEGQWHSTSSRIVGDASELRTARAGAAAPGGLLLQEYVPGHGEGIFLLASEGRTLVRFSHRRVREKPPTGGVSVVAESIVPDPLLLERSERLLESLGWTGVVMVELRRSNDGHAYLMEINPRLWGSLQLAVDAGIDFPSLLVGLHQGRPIDPVEPRIGVRTRWLLGDLDALFIGLRRRRVRELTGQRLRSVLGGFLRGFVDGSRSDVLRWDDLGPFRRELRDRLGA